MEDEEQREGEGDHEGSAVTYASTPPSLPDLEIAVPWATLGGLTVRACGIVLGPV
jgi:hypothetical protein